MGENSKIEWCHHTFNSWRGCTKISAGCAHCYAETWSKRNPATLGVWGDNGTRVIASDSYWKQPVKWNRDAEKAGERRRVFCASLADVFEDREDLIKPRFRLFNLIRATQSLDYLLLTKRIDRVRPILEAMQDIAKDCVTEHAGQDCAAVQQWIEDWLNGQPPANVWMGCTVENQEQADRRIPALLNIPARVRFLSCEPLLGPLEFSDVTRRSDAVLQLGKKALDGIHWVIVGGESGPNARPMNLKWARSLRDQCIAAKVPFHFKQWGEFTPYYEGINTETLSIETREFTQGVKRVGKKAAGRVLDGRTWDEFPSV